MEPEITSESSLASPRAALLAEMVAAARRGSPRALLLGAPRGWGKRSLLDAAAAALDPREILAVPADFGRSVTNPDEVACAFAAELLDAAEAGGASAIPGISGRPSPAARFRAAAASSRLRDLHDTSRAAAALITELARRRGEGRKAVAGALDLASALARDLARPIVIVARGFDELARLVHFPGLDDAPEMIARWLARTPPVRLLGETSPAGRPRRLLDALADALGPEFALRSVPPMSAEEIAGAAGCSGGEAARILALTGGRALTSGILAERLRSGSSLEEAIAAELDPGASRLHQELRFDYHQLLERTRGYAASRAILNTLAREEGLDLSGIAGRLRRSAGSTLDYLRWLVEVGLLRREGRRYLFTDPLQRLHVLVHEAPEHPESPSGRRAVIHRFLASLGAEPIPLRQRGRPPGRIAGASPVKRRAFRPSPRAGSPSPSREEKEPPRRDSLIEID